MTKNTLATIAVLGVIAATSFTALADERDKKTVITTKESLIVPGKVLPPGKYVMKLMESPNRNIVTIYNEDQSQLQTMFIAIPDYKVNRSSDVELTFWETPAGSPKALRSWFTPGENFGQEFAYPKAIAEQLARDNNGAKVPSYDADANAALNQDQLAQLDIQNKPDANVSSASGTTPTVSDTSSFTPEKTPVAQARQSITPSPEPVSLAPQPEVRSDNTVLAQNTPAPSPIVSNTASNTASDASQTPTELPQTASPLSWVLLVGLVSLSFAIAMRRARV